MNRRSRMPRAIVVLAAIACVTLTGINGGPTATDAAWTDAEVASSGTMSAGAVTPVTGLGCSDGVLQPVILTWPAPVGGVTRSGYRWTLTGGLTASGTLAANATSLTLNSGGLITIGSGVFSLYAVGPVGTVWESLVPAQADISFLSVVLGVNSSCDPR